MASLIVSTVKADLPKAAQAYASDLQLMQIGLSYDEGVRRGERTRIELGGEDDWMGIEGLRS